MRHGKKAHNLQLKQETTNYVDERKRPYIKHTLHDFSLYLVSNKTTVKRIHCSFIWYWSSYPNKIKRWCYKRCCWKMYGIIKYVTLQIIYNRSYSRHRAKIQKILRKMKSKFSEQEYKWLYPTDSAPAWFKVQPRCTR